MRFKDLSQTVAYDQARGEYYRYRLAREVEDRVAREEALATGAFFGPGPLEIGMQLEDGYYENWKEWAIKEAQALKQLSQSAYSGTDEEEAETSALLSSPDSQQTQPPVPGRTGVLASGVAPAQPA
jgi:small subunit ribosomal protein S23